MPLGPFAAVGTQCIQGWVESLSSPGAGSISWSGKAYSTEPVLEASDFFNLASMTQEAFDALFEPDPPNLDTDSPASQDSLSCNACQGGTLQLDHITMDRRYIKSPAVYLYGVHTFEVGGVDYELETDHFVNSPSTGRDWRLGRAHHG